MMTGKFPRFLLVLVVLWGGSHAGAHAQALLAPPFGLQWADPPAKLLDWAERHAMDVSIRLPGGARDLRIIRVDLGGKPLPGTKATAVEARFRLGRLFEVTVDYDDTQARVEAIKARYLELRKALTTEYGEMKVNRRDPPTRSENFVSESITHHVEPAPGLFLLLTYSTVEDILREKALAKFSLVYRNENLFRQLVPGAAGN
jgi:hypothetical protein